MLIGTVLVSSEMAADYLALIRTVQPTGPYYLLGWSFGGLVAHEMGVQLTAAGEHVALLGLLDAFPATDAAVEQELYGGPELVGEARQWLAGELVDQLGGLAAWERVVAHNARLMRDFVPGVLAGDAVLFTADRDRSAHRPGAAAWRAHVTGRIIHHSIDTTHHALAGAEPIGRIGRLLAEAIGRSGQRPAPVTESDERPE